MAGKFRSRVARLVALGVMAAVLIPASLAFGSHDGAVITSDDAGYVFLRMGNQDRVIFESQVQPIATKKSDCTAVSFGSDPQLLAVSPDGGVLGEVKDGLGVKSPNDGSGEPCGRVEGEDSETITVSLGSDMSGYLMAAVDVDLELKFGAIVTVIYRHGGSVVATDTFDPSDASDDGPDSADGDNYRYFHRPMDGADQIYFDSVEFAPTAGALSLEGGADGTESGSLAGNNYSQFEVFMSFDGEITCGDEISISDATADVSGQVTMHALLDETQSEPSWDPGCVLLKLYNDDVNDTQLFFIPELEDTRARYTLVFTAVNQPVTTNNGQITSLVMDYSPVGDFGTSSLPLEACQGEPNLDKGTAAYETFWSQADVGLLPDLETACFYSAEVDLTGTGEGTEVWGIYFEDDPGFSAR